jgi:hypothetical protein
LDQLTKPAAVLANRRQRLTSGGPEMVPLSDLARNPVSVVVFDEGAEFHVSAERGKAGKVWLTCQCRDSSSEGWCKHRLALLCARYDNAPTASGETRRAFEQIVTGTKLCEAGRNADRAMRVFEDCLLAFDRQRPTRIVGRSLGKFTDLVSDLAVCSGELEDALGALRRLLERV